MLTPQHLKILSVAERDIEAGEILEYRIRGRRMKFYAVNDIKAGQDLFWYGIAPIGLAARDIPKGTTINYKPNENTADVIVFEERENANTP
jgi:predicted homoserine dehydrogenase-like protein